MEIIGVVVIGVLAIGLIGGSFYLLFWIMGAISGGINQDQVSNNSTDLSADKSGMNQGDFHSGPGGYSPNTAYPDTFYGSGGKSDDFGGHDEGDFSR